MGKDSSSKNFDNKEAQKVMEQNPSWATAVDKEKKNMGKTDFQDSTTAFVKSQTDKD